MSDIRSFFGVKGQTAGAAAKTSATSAKINKSQAPAKRRRTTHAVLEDSDDNDNEQVKNVADKKATPHFSKKNGDTTIKGVETTAHRYFASSKSESKPQETPETRQASQLKTESPVRVSPRTRQAATEETTSALPSRVAAAAARKPAASPTEKRSAPLRRHKIEEDLDAYKDDDGSDADDIFAADAKARKRKTDDYIGEDSDDPVPQPKRVASRQGGSRSVTVEKLSPASSKRKTLQPVPESLSDSGVRHRTRPVPSPAKPKPRTKTTSAPRAKKADEEKEDETIQKIMEDIPLVHPPSPEPDAKAKFNWRKGPAPALPPPNPGGSEIPDGEEECLSGLTFVFTGVLQTIGREEAQSLVKRYGGKVTGQPSSKTSFVVLGDDAGPTKLAKIKQLGVKSINEEGLFDLIRKLPAFGGSGQGAQKAQEKKKADEDKIRHLATEMEQEENVRRLQEEAKRRAGDAKQGNGPGSLGAADSSSLAKAAASKLMPTREKFTVTEHQQLWTTKYAPTQLAHICGNKAQVERIQSWLRNWPKTRKDDYQKRGADGIGGSRAIIISGPPGIGKTTAAHLAARMEGYDVIESNASDTRSKKLVEEGLTDVMKNLSLLGFLAAEGTAVDSSKKKIVLVMDEVDGMSAGDRGGVGALTKLCRKTAVPLILICNERNLPKMRPFDGVAFDIKFTRPTVDQVRSRLMTICHREGLKLPPAVIDALIEGCNRDVRQMINMISTIKLDGQTSMDYDDTKAMTKSWEKHIILKPWDICQKLLGGGMFAPASKATLNDKIELYFNDHEFSYLMIQENYLRTKPSGPANTASAAGHDKQSQRRQRLRVLELFDEAAASISDGDLVDCMIHGPQQHWSLMPTHAIFSTVRPCSLVAGQLLGSQFTTWLGMNSKQGRLARLGRELHSHMRLRASGNHHEVRMQYLPILWDRMVGALAAGGRESVDGVITLMDSYFLTREDFDSVKELGVGPQREDDVNIETQTKATFTRMYNSKSHPMPFVKASNVLAPRRPVKETPDLEEAIEDEDDAAGIAPEAEADEAAAVDDELDIKNDKYIKLPKARASRKSSKKQDDGDADPDTKPSAKGPKKARCGGRAEVVLG